MPVTNNTDLLKKKDENLLSGLFASPNETPLANASAKGVRLASLDFYRGLIMVFLMLESTGLYEHWVRMCGNGFFIVQTNCKWRFMEQAIFKSPEAKWMVVFLGCI